MGEVIDLDAFREKKNLCPTCGDGQSQPCFAECFDIPTNWLDNFE